MPVGRSWWRVPANAQAYVLAEKVPERAETARGTIKPQDDDYYQHTAADRTGEELLSGKWG